ncbi:MAG: hypothetical protein QGE99_00595 [SAR202 cluster bacterium]|jgi:hypothetical protein|nr:hypothetical protein [SAR202 cluster bacterium]
MKSIQTIISTLVVSLGAIYIAYNETQIGREELTEVSGKGATDLATTPQTIQMRVFS